MPSTSSAGQDLPRTDREAASGLAAPRPTKGQATRERILDVAEALFAERGFESTSLREIARGVGIQQPGLYNHFKNKEALYAAVLDRALEPLSLALESAMQSTAPDQMQSTLAGVMTDLLVEHPKMSSLFQRALQGDPTSVGNRLIKHWLDRLFAQAIEGRTALLDDGADRLDLALETIAMFNLTTGFFLSQRILEPLVGRNITEDEVVARQKALLERFSDALTRR